PGTSERQRSPRSRSLASALADTRRDRRLEHLGDECLLVHRWADVALVRLARRELDRLGGQVLVGDQAEQVGDQVESCAALVVAVDHVPRRLPDVGVAEHLVLGLRILDPARPRLEVHRAELPALGRIVEASLEAPLLLRIADREPVLDHDDSLAHEHALELRAAPEELLDLLLGREAHYALDAGAVVPAAVEQDHLARSGQVGDVALEIPLAPLTLGGRRQGGDACDPWAHPQRDRFDRAALAGGVATLEHDDDPQALDANPLLELDELDAEAANLRLVRRTR